MDLLNRLKQAADFPTTEVSGESTWDDSTPKEEVIKLLQIAENELRQLRKQHEDLREESTEQIKEHGEYRAKVQGWRKQTQLDREASKNMIISLRGSDASKTDMDNSYIKNLHEQVTILKDNIRQSTEKAEKNANERDMLEKAWRDRFEKYNDEVEKWKTTLATTSDSPTQGEPSSADTLKLIQKENELETCNDLVKDLRSQLEESKKNLEESNAKAAGSIKQIQDIIESHERQINQLKAEQEVKLNSLQDGSQTKYIKDLETELKQWRQSSSTNVQDTSDEASSPVPSAVIVAGDEDLSKQLDREREEKKKLSADLCEALNRAASLETKIESSSARYLQIDSTSDAREQAIQSLFDENNQLRCEMEQKSIELSEAYSASDELQLRVTELLTEAYVLIIFELSILCFNTMNTTTEIR